MDFGNILNGFGKVLLGSTNSTTVTQQPAPQQAPKGLSTGAIVGITVAGVLVVGGIVTVIILSK